MPLRLEILVFAAASLTDALTEIGAAYESAHPGARVRFHFAASNDLARQIRAGAPADLFFSADRENMDALEQEGLVDPRTRADLLSNSLVVVVPSASRLRLSRAGDLAAGSIRRVAIADPATVPAGRYARAWLEREGIWDRIAQRVLPTLDVRAVLAAVAAGSADCGIVYRTDAAISKRSRVVFAVSESRAPPIVYSAARVTGRQGGRGVPADRVRGSTAFLEHLRGETALSVFRRHGFRVLEGAGQR